MKPPFAAVRGHLARAMTSLPPDSPSSQPADPALDLLLELIEKRERHEPVTQAAHEGALFKALDAYKRLAEGTASRPGELRKQMEETGLLHPRSLARAAACALQTNPGAYLPSIAALSPDGVQGLAISSDGKTFPLVAWAAYHHGEAEVAEVLRLGADPFEPSDDGLTALSCAASASKPETVRLLLSAQAPTAAQIDSRGGSNRNTALFLAVGAKCHEAAELLIAAGAGVDIPDSDGVSPLAMAAIRKDSRMVQLLLAAGADPHAKDSSGEDALLSAFSNVSTSMTTDMDSPLVETVRLLVASGANPNAQDAKGNTALHRALAHRNAALVEILAPCSDFSVRNDDGRTALDLVLERKDWGTADLLAAHGGEEIAQQAFAALLADKMPNAFRALEARELRKAISAPSERVIVLPRSADRQEDSPKRTPPPRL
jgi:ankyrin repeat protein